MEIASIVLEYVKAIIWPVFALIFVLLFRTKINVALGRLKGADLPGGVSLNFSEEIREAQELSREVKSTSDQKEKGKKTPSIPITEANARMLSLNLQPTPSGLDFDRYRILADEDPNLALAGLRMEMEIIAHNVAKGFKVEIDKHVSAGLLFRKLYDRHAISTDQYQLAQKVLKLCNAAVHGIRVSREEANNIIDSAAILAEQYIDWLSWGFEDGWQPTSSGK
ncbi:MAG: hypothetical protein WC880_04525 [Candidatus Paceibacterota bacterium]